LILVYWAWDEVRASLMYLKIVWQQNRNKRLMWDAFWGNRSEPLDRAAETLLSREVA
jgi:hypothetical protein